MPLTSLFKRKNKSPAEERSAVPAGTDETGPVQEARNRARRRLIGAVVLLAVGIIGFPLLFETAPRPIPVNIPIEIPRKDGQPPLPAPLPSLLPSLPPAATPPPGGAVITESPAEAGTEAPSPPAASAAAGSAPASAPVRAAAAAAQRASAAAKVDDGQRARALLEGASVAKPASSAPQVRASDAQAGRFVVQVGAYTDAAALRDARQKVEKLGMKTYTQVIETDAGKRTRVRVGPFATREEAAAAGQALKAAGLPANILVL
jgi:DedD protein